MDKILNPGKYGLAFCPLCSGKGKLPKNPHGFDVCTKCGGFGLVKKEEKVLEEDKKEIST
jgi:DnaJ-class molecular chaperone